MIAVPLDAEDIRRCDEFGRPRAAEKNDAAKYDTRGFFENDAMARLLYVRGEYAFHKLTGLPLDWTMGPRKGGPDFTAGKLTIDIKTGIYEGSRALTVQYWKNEPGYRCDAYVHCRLDALDLAAKIMRQLQPADLNVVIFEGFAWAEDVFLKKNYRPADKEKKHTPHYRVEEKDLHDLAELLAFIGPPAAGASA